MVGSGDHFPTMQALLKRVEKAFSSFSLEERSGSFSGPITPIFFSFVKGTLYPTFRPTPVWQEFSPLMSLMLSSFRSLWMTTTASYLNSARKVHTMRFHFAGVRRKKTGESSMKNWRHLVVESESHAGSLSSLVLANIDIFICGRFVFLLRIYDVGFIERFVLMRSN